MPIKFVDVLQLKADGGVDAKGPKDEGDEVIDICAWVIQQGENDAAATEMTTTGGHLEQDAQSWTLPLGKLEKGVARLTDGPAFAAAVALVKDRDNKQKVAFWAQTVRLEKTPTSS